MVRGMELRDRPARTAGGGRIVIRGLLTLGLVLAAAACSSGGSSTTPSPHESGFLPSAAPTTRATPPLAEALRACPVTVPNGSPPPGEAPDATYLGNGRLWTSLWPHGLVLVPPDDIARDGWLGMKFPWWRGSGVHGHLHISGYEIASGDSIRAHTSGYGVTGFNATGIFFPVEGCYRVTGEADGVELTFVTLVRTCSALAELPPRERGRYSICRG
jgi:hypothetical protein